MKKTTLILAFSTFYYSLVSAQFNETSTEVQTFKEIVAPVTRLSNELRVANSFVPSDPTIGILDNTGFGINIDKTSGIGFALNSYHIMVINPNGDVSAPVLLLDNELRVANSFVPSDPIIGTFDNTGFGINIHKIDGIGFAFNGVHKMIFKPNGNAYFSGKLETKEIKVTNTPTADFVFDVEYEIPSLEFVDNYIKENKHLPEIASAKEMKENGVNIGEFQIKLLQKIEELTLYTIAQEKKLEDYEALENRYSELQEKVIRIENIINQLLEKENRKL